MNFDIHDIDKIYRLVLANSKVGARQVDESLSGLREEGIDTKDMILLGRSRLGSAPVNLPSPLVGADLTFFVTNLGFYSAIIDISAVSNKVFRGISGRLEELFFKNGKELSWIPSDNDGCGYVVRKSEQGIPIISVSRTTSDDGDRHLYGRMLVLGDNGAEPRKIVTTDAFSEQVCLLRSVAAAYANCCLDNWKGLRGMKNDNDKYRRGFEKLTLLFNCF